jgi:hypothetical protein
LNKYSNKKTRGYDSKKESRRAQELWVWQAVGAISELKEQVKFELVPKQDGERVVTYIADFTYLQDGKFVVEDAKGMRTPYYILKRKLMLHKFGIKVLET